MPNRDGTGPNGNGCEGGRGTGHGAGGQGRGRRNGTGRHPRCPRNRGNETKTLDETQNLNENE